MYEWNENTEDVQLMMFRLAARAVRSWQEGVIVSRANGTEGMVD